MLFARIFQSETRHAFRTHASVKGCGMIMMGLPEFSPQEEDYEEDTLAGCDRAVKLLMNI
jgi:hypothetical protein